MKKWTKRFLEKRHKNIELVDRSVNARAAKKKLGVPEKLWCELSQYAYCVLAREIDSCVGIDKSSRRNTDFLAGFAVGWAEKNRKIK